MRSYFGCESSFSGRPVRRLITLTRAIVNAIALEEEVEADISEKYRKAHPYPPLFVNDLICAYAWCVLSNERLKDLVVALNERLKYVPDTNLHERFGEKVVTDQKNLLSLVPFRPGEHIITNSTAFYKGDEFADCVETTLRQFFATLFCTRENVSSGALGLDARRIPANIKLYDFFVSRCKNENDIRTLANDNTSGTRNAWAEIVSGLDVGKKTYFRGDHEINGGWDNCIKVICSLMAGYEAGDAPNDDKESPEYKVWERKKAAETRIKTVNSDVKAGTFDILPDEALKAINDLLGIRTDVELVAKQVKDVPFCEADVIGEMGDGEDEVDERNETGTLKKTSDCIEGVLVIYPQEHVKNNKLYFSNLFGHAYLKKVPREDRLREADSTSSWIEKLYYNREAAIRGQNTEAYGEIYPVIDKALYPTLEYYLRLNGAIRHEHLIPTILEKLCDKAYIESVACLFYGQHKGLSLSDAIKKAKEVGVPQENLIEFCYFIARKAESPINAALASDFLQKEASQRIEDMDKNISIDSSMADLLINRCVFKNDKEVDKILAQKIENLNDKTCEEIGLLLDDMIKFYTANSKEGLVQMPLLENEVSGLSAQGEQSKKRILDSVVRYAKSVMEKIKNLEDPQNFREIARNIVNILDIINFSEVPPDLSEFLTLIRDKLPLPISCIRILHFRSDEKLEALLPICDIDVEEALADQILSDYKGPINFEMGAAFLMSVSLSRIKEVINRIIADVPTSASKISFEFFKDMFLVPTNRFKSGKIGRLHEILKAITNNCSKLSTAEAEEILGYTKEPLAVISAIKPGEDLPEGICKSIDSWNSENVQQALEDIFAYEINIPLSYEAALAKRAVDVSPCPKISPSMLQKFSNSFLIQLILNTSESLEFSQMYFQSLFELLESRSKMSPELALRIYQKYYFMRNLSFFENVLRAISGDALTPEAVDSICLISKEYIPKPWAAHTLIKGMYRRNYKIHKAAIPKLLEYNDENDVVSAERIFSLLLPEEKLSQEDVDKIWDACKHDEEKKEALIANKRQIKDCCDPAVASYVDKLFKM